MAQMTSYPEIEVVAEPNRRPSGGHPMEGLLVIGAVLVGGYFLVKSGTLGTTFGGVSTHGILTTSYSGATVSQSCGTVSASVGVVNDTLSTLTGTLKGYLVPAGQTSTASVNGHFWQSLSGIGSTTAYHGVSVSVPSFHEVRYALQAGHFDEGGRTYSVIWQLTNSSGTTLVTKTDANVIKTTFSSKGSCTLV